MVSFELGDKINAFVTIVLRKTAWPSHFLLGIIPAAPRATRAAMLCYKMRKVPIISPAL